MPNESTRAGAGPSWPLRLALGLCVSVLVVVGFALKTDHHAPTSAATTTQPITTTSGSGATTTNPTSTSSTPTTSTPTTQPGTPVTNLPPPIINMTAFKPPGAGCRFATGAPGPTQSSSNTTTTSIGDTTTVPVTTSKAVEAAGRCTVLEIGDSLGNDLGWGLARELGHAPGLRLVQADKSSTGLTTPWFYNWPQKEKVLLAQYKPQLVVIMFGANDEQNLKVNGQVLAFMSAPWVKAYTSVVTGMATAATKSGAYVLWVGMPIMLPNGYRQGMQFINSQFVNVTDSVPGMAFLPTWDLFATAKGDFMDAARVNNVPSILREADGIHLSYVGENVIATFVARNIGSVFHVQITPEAAMYIDH
jgi:hypothetical protein